VYCICARSNDCKSDFAYRGISDVVGISHRSFCKCKRVMHMICMNKVVCSELGERAVFFREFSKDDIMSSNMLSAYLSVICSLLDRSRWTYGDGSGSQPQVATQSRLAWSIM
jgi:hypothetical protein